MTPKAKKALEGSIRKWERIVTGEGVDNGWRNCPLCAAFNKDEDCRGCPVRKSTGKNLCEGTPYEKWCDAQDEWQNQEWGSAITEKQRKAALAMLRFLESLR